ncbi:MAG TPA: hypothetical protein VFF73_05805 [Planctomycetota bacterium]|nr:hypothetical protein [Planctomycetota bacterium]
MHRRLLAVAIVLLFSGSALADAVVLRNGRRIEGRIISDNDKEVTIETGSGALMRFERRLVASLERDEKVPKPDTKPTATPLPDDLGAPEGATDDEVERLKALVPQLRETAKRWLDAKKERETAEKANDPGLQTLKDREGEFQKQLDTLKQAREAIDKAAADRLDRDRREAKADTERLHLDTERLRLASDAGGLADRALQLRGKVPESARDPRHAPFLAEALYAMECSVDLDEKSASNKAAPLLRAGTHLAWCVENDESVESRYLARAVTVLTAAHRAAGFDTAAAERALEGLLAYRTCAHLVEERLGERRWGAELTEKETGQYRVELADGKVVYADDIPTAADARSARERRSRNESRTVKDATGATTTTLVNATRWYELGWDATKKRWVRDPASLEIEAKKRVPLLLAAQDAADALAKAKKAADAAARAVATSRDAFAIARRKADQGEPADDLEKSKKQLAERQKAAADAQVAIAEAQAALGQEQRQLALVEKEIERARKGE